MPIAKVHDFRAPTEAQAADLLRRAMVAWLSSDGVEVPDASRSKVRLHQGLGYVVLHGASSVLAVYRIRPDNLALRRMKRWPATIER